MQTSTAQKIHDFIVHHPSLDVYKDGEKVKCSLSGHEMPCRLDVLQSYTNGKKYKKLRAKYDLDHEEYMQHLESGTGKGDHVGHLYCKLTGRYLSSQPQHVRRHVEGKRFKKALFRWNECQRTGEEFKPRQPLIKKNKVEAMDIGDMEDDEDNPDLEFSDDEDQVGGDDEGPENEDDDDMADFYPTSESDESMADDAMEVENDESDYDFGSLENNLGQQSGAVNDQSLNSKRKPVKDGHLTNGKKLKTTDANGGKNKKKNKKRA